MQSSPSHWINGARVLLQAWLGCRVHSMADLLFHTERHGRGVAMAIIGIAFSRRKMQDVLHTVLVQTVQRGCYDGLGGFGGG